MNETLLNCFTDSKGEFISGEELSRVLGVSRTAIWKRIRRLEEAGYSFESVPGLGYRLVASPERIQLNLLLAKLGNTAFGKAVKLYDTVDSTQNIAHESLIQGAPEGTLIIAEQQRSGRGRLGRTWHSPMGKGIYMSFLLRPDLPMAMAPQMTLLVSVALCRAIRKETGLQAMIKWPNDVLVDGKKVSGTLVETIAEADTVKAMIAGVGISVNFDESDFPSELRSKATSLKVELGRSISRESLIAAFFAQFEPLYDLYRTDGFAPIRSLWEALATTLHSEVVVTTGQGVIRGVAENITAEGALQVRDAEGNIQTLYSGDLATLRPQ